ncbi:Signal transducer [Aspergillus sp. HF37]|nr:Signal transducer [Aspergillus sp. HF37]
MEEDLASSGPQSSMEDEEPVDSLVGGRGKRSTAGRHMSALLNAEADDELALLFEEVGEDNEFSEAGEDEGDDDMRMDSSSEDEEDQGPNAKETEDEGEKEIQREARVERRKRRAQDDLRFKALRKKVKIDPTAVSAAPPPRQKKKSERISWIPTPDEGPTRSSSRRQTMQNKEHTHARLKDSEEKRVRLIATMEEAAKRKAHLKPKGRTQAEWLAEAARMERVNSKSLNRWEETEKRKADERRAKIEALQNRRLEGPVMSYWSGIATWVDGRLTRVGKVDVKHRPKPDKEEPARRKSKKLEKDDRPFEITGAGPSQTSMSGPESTPGPRSIPGPGYVPGPGSIPWPGPMPTTPGSMPGPGPQISVPPDQVETMKQDQSRLENRQIDTNPDDKHGKRTDGTTPASTENSYVVPTKPSDTVPDSGQVMEPAERMQSETDDSRATEEPSKENANFAVVIGTPKAPAATEADTQPTSQKPEGQPIPQPDHKQDWAKAAPEPSGVAKSMVETPGVPSAPPTAIPIHATQQGDSPGTQGIIPAPIQQSQIPHIHSDHAIFTNDNMMPPRPPLVERTGRNVTILEDFDEETAQSRKYSIYFNAKKPGRLSKISSSLCVITSLPSRYRDTTTYLPFANSYAYREIQRTAAQQYSWSPMLGCYVGPAGIAAQGVPERFLNPDADRQSGPGSTEAGT